VTTTQYTAGLVLLAHGSRDPNWRKPFEQLQQTIQAQASDAWVGLAYMEMAQPTLEQVLNDLPASIKTVEILPMFMATGGHMANDVPKLVHDAQERFPQVAMTQHPPVGEHPLVKQAFTELALDLLRGV